jgi:hypothetical protein
MKQTAAVRIGILGVSGIAVEHLIAILTFFDNIK